MQSTADVRTAVAVVAFVVVAVVVAVVTRTSTVLVVRGRGAQRLAESAAEPSQKCRQEPFTKCGPSSAGSPREDGRLEKVRSLQHQLQILKQYNAYVKS